MRRLGLVLMAVWPVCIFGQASNKATETGKETTYKNRVLEATEVELLTSLYGQDGNNGAVTGGIGSEKLKDAATNINVSIPLNADDVLTIDATVSAYTSASSSNLNPFSGVTTYSYGTVISGASRGGGRNRSPFGYTDPQSTTVVQGSPWVAASGASRSDVWYSGGLSYSHTSDDRNSIYSGHLNASKEFDYGSFGAGLGFVRQFNQKNTEIGLQGTVYLDAWYPQYPTEIHTYFLTQGNLNAGFFSGVDILDANGQVINKSSANVWHPSQSTLLNTYNRNSYSLSVSFSQILSKRSQFSIFSDLVYQQGWLANPMQRVYFSDVANYYIGNANDIPNYETRLNTRVFQLADDIERLPQTRLKIPVGLRYNYYINEFLVLRSYYRYYYDDWGITSHTASIEIPIKVGTHFTLYPNYRYYTQTAAKYFAPYEQHLSTETFYTSDYDLSAFQANQIGFGLKYTDIFLKSHLGNLGIKSVSLNYNYYRRNTGLHAGIVSLGIKFVTDR
ncbi:MAG: DUF3570 domain-containing protein [Saprospiraceae bacterium]